MNPEMALEAVVFPHNLLDPTLGEFNGQLGGGSWPWGWSIEDDKGQAFNGNWEASCSPAHHEFDDWNTGFSNPAVTIDGTAAVAGAAGGRKKRRQTKGSKNKEAAENQRMTHIAVERNRRKQMNDYLAVLRSLMPPSFVPRGDQASIIGSAINFIKELEHFLNSSEVRNQLRHQPASYNPLASFFTSPQYSSDADSPVSCIEVALVENHASLKVLLRRRPKQLLQLVMGLQNLHLSTLHLNVNTVEPMTLYSLTIKVEDGCLLNSVDEIAAAVHGIVVKIQRESGVLLA